jgi:hypothetical protein
LQDLVGRKKYAELRAAIASERLALRELQQPPEGLKRDHGKDRLASKRRVDALLRRLGVNSGKVERIQNDTREKLRGLLTPAGANTVPGYSMANHGADWRRLTGLNSDVVLTVAPPPDDPNDPHRWFWYMPPYIRFAEGEVGFHTDFAHYPVSGSGFVVDREFFSSAAGWIGSELTLDDSDAGDADWAYGWAESAIELRFNTPAAGRVEVVIQAQCLSALHEVSLVDEFGLSDAWTRQRNYLYLHVPGDVRSFAPMSMLPTESDGEEVAANGHSLIPGNHYFANLSSTLPVQQGVQYLVRAGSYNFANAFTNDMAVHCRSIFMWQIHSVGIRIAP